MRSSTFDICWQLITAVDSCQNIFYLHLILTSFMQNVEFLALEMTELWIFKYFWQLLTAVNSCKKTSLHLPDVCLTLCCFPISIFKLCMCVNSTALNFHDFIHSHSYYIDSCQNTSLHFPYVCLTLGCLPICSICV